VLADAPLGRGGTWSPEGVIVFTPTSYDPLMRVAATGGTVTPVTRLAVGQGSHRYPQFLPDGRRFLFLTALGRPETHAIYVGSLDGGEPTLVTPAETAAAYVEPGYLLLVSQGVLTAHPFDVVRATLAGDPIVVAQRGLEMMMGRFTAPSPCRDPASWRIARMRGPGASSSGPIARVSL
jgi:eukaryotic-like serine/threonine-protein kinase